MQTADTSNLFQSDQQHARASFRAAKYLLHAESGDPIKLGSKPLRIVVRQGKQGREAEAWCAESGFVVRRLGLEEALRGSCADYPLHACSFYNCIQKSGKTRQIYRGHFGPVTSLDFYTVPATPKSELAPAKPSREVLVSGSWDKSFRIWDTLTKTALSTTLAHTDFVKALLVIPSLKILVTGSSDKDLRIWDLSVLSTRDFEPLLTANAASTTASPEEDEEGSPVEESTASSALPEIKIPTGAAPPTPISSNPLPVLLSLKGHTRPIERLAYYHITTNASGNEPVDSGKIALISVDSLGALKTWALSRGSDGVMKGELKSEIRPHEIGIYDIVVGDGEIWTASADNSALLSSFDSSTPSIAPIPILRIPHPSSVKALLPLSIVLPSLNSNHLLTGAGDESIRVFDLNEIDSDNNITTQTQGWIGLPYEGKLIGMVKEIEGNCHDIVDLKIFMKDGEGGKKEAWILSASIDGTLRRWKWPDVLKEEGVKKVLVEVEEKEEEKKSVMTEEEERELEEFLEIIDED